MAEAGPAEWIEAGHIVGAYGVKGWLRVIPHTADPDALIRYKPWRFRGAPGSLEPTVLDVQPHGRGFVVHVAECATREAAEAWKGAVLEVPVTVLPVLPAGEYYWGQLIGLAVETQEGRSLGTIVRLIETGANDVLIVQGERERLLPYVPHVVRAVDLAGRRMIVDWDPEF
ncbi:MAG: ribosome maturation factor RimM [Gammaproteobacteria bacterium]|nr:ribosome maturation factor RimM [Gammaproteobacteria bacterium]